MSKDMMFSNIVRMASRMFTQFSTDEPMISEEVQTILKSKQGRDEVESKLMHKRTPGEVTVTVNGKDTKFFVEA